MQKETFIIACAVAFIASCTSFSLHWLMQDGHPLAKLRRWVEENLIGSEPPLDLRTLKPDLPKWQYGLRYYFGMLIAGCAVCQSFWIATFFCIIFTSVPLLYIPFVGFMAMTITYKIY